jgi:competence protein ComEA
VDALTPAERRGAIIVVVLLALGAAQDLWRASRPLPAASPGLPGSIASPLEEGAGAGALGDGADRVHDRGVAAPGAAGAIVDLNRASALDLDGLPGVGPVLAGRIIAHRSRHGPFRHPEELLAVRGIGPRLFAKLVPRVTAGPGPPAGRAFPDRAGPDGLQSAARPAPLRADSGSVRPPTVPITRQD